MSRISALSNWESTGRVADCHYSFQLNIPQEEAQHFFLALGGKTCEPLYGINMVLLQLAFLTQLYLNYKNCHSNWNSLAALIYIIYFTYSFFCTLNQKFVNFCQRVPKDFFGHSLILLNKIKIQIKENILINNVYSNRMIGKYFWLFSYAQNSCFLKFLFLKFTICKKVQKNLPVVSFSRCNGDQHWILRSPKILYLYTGSLSKWQLYT